jgi:iron complex transport system substrate-binding protein
MRAGWSCLLLLAGCSGQPAISPAGIVSNNPCIDAILAEIAAPGQIAAVSSYSHDADSASAPLLWANTMPAIGTSAEEIIAAQPRLLLTGNLASAGTNAALAKAGVKLVAVGVPASVDDSKAQIRLVGSAIGRAEAGEGLIARIDQTVAPNDAQGPPITAIIWQNGGFVPGKGTLQDDLLAAHGFANASVSYGLKSWDVLPLETLIRKPPQVIFMPQSAKGDDARTLAARRQLLRHLKGKVRIVAFPDRLLFCGGPTIIKVSQIFAQTRQAMR